MADMQPKRRTEGQSDADDSNESDEEVMLQPRPVIGAMPKSYDQLKGYEKMQKGYEKQKGYEVMQKANDKMQSYEKMQSYAKMQSYEKSQQSYGKNRRATRSCRRPRERCQS